MATHSFQFKNQLYNFFPGSTGLQAKGPRRNTQNRYFIQNMEVHSCKNITLNLITVQNGRRLASWRHVADIRRVVYY